MSALGLEVIEAESGPEAIEISHRHRLHAALLDLHMPGQTGLEVIPQLHLVHVGLPCIVYSGALTEALESTAQSLGAFAVLHKPVDPTVLRAEVLRAIASYDKSA